MINPPTTEQIAHLAALLIDHSRVYDPDRLVLHALKLWKEAERQIALDPDFATFQKSASIDLEKGPAPTLRGD